MDATGSAYDGARPIPWVGLALMPEEQFRAAAAPLFSEGVVDVVEWSLDLGFDRVLPAWLAGLLDHYASAGRLLGHGVHYSPLSAVWEPRQARWLESLSRELATRSYLHVSEHYGFMTTPQFSRGAPLPVPRGPEALRVGRDRLRSLRERLSCPLGLENLALAWNREEALAHGDFLGALLEDASDFVLLDLHNLYCQAVNFELTPRELLATYPLERVRELHLSGGSWQGAWPDGPGASIRVRCDTHDERIPEPLFALLREALARCPNVRAVIVERLGDTLVSSADARSYAEDFQRVRAIVQEPRARVSLPPRVQLPADEALYKRGEERSLAAFQAKLLELLWSEREREVIERRLIEEPELRPFRWETSGFDPRALGMATRVVKKWARPRSE